MWMKWLSNHKILDIEKISKKSLIFGQKSVDKTVLGLVY